MSDTSEKQENVNTVVLQQGKVDGTARVISIGQFCIGVIGICLTLAITITAGVNSINARIAELTQENIQQNSRIGNLEEKTRGYDELIKQRQLQYNDTTERLVRIETLLGARTGRGSKNSDGGL